MIVQILPTLSYGDAIGNYTLAIGNLLKKAGYTTKIYAESVDRRLPRGRAAHISRLPELTESDTVIYHASTGTLLNYSIAALRAKKIMIYHNITPPSFFRDYSEKAQKLTRKGYEGMRYLSDKVDFCIADSEYNRQDLLRMGYSCGIEVCPVMIPFEDYRKEPSPDVVSRYRDGVTNIIFVGRIAPNKKQEDLIASFYFYKKYYNGNSRLILVGSDGGMETYRADLEAYAVLLGISGSVIFTGHVSFGDILAYYSIADLFLCMSEHEGFCVPLVEAMFFKVPVLAYGSSAIPSTLGEKYVISSKEPHFAAKKMNDYISDVSLREEIKAYQDSMLEKYSQSALEDRFLKLIGTVCTDGCRSEESV